MLAYRGLPQPFASAVPGGSPALARRLLPATLPASRWLKHYAQHFDTVEINNSFIGCHFNNDTGGLRHAMP
jgi:uncharacterized protein YecE (DUF72 family)